MTQTRLPYLGFRLGENELATVDSIAKLQNCSRSEAARSALRLGLPLARAGHSIDIPRLILLLEYMQASIDVIINREHADAADELIQIAQQRMEQFHAK